MRWVCVTEMQRLRLAWTVVRAGQRGMDDWRWTGTFGDGDARRRRGRRQLRQWRLGSPECLGWHGEGRGKRKRRSTPPGETHPHKQTHHDVFASHTHGRGLCEGRWESEVEYG